jgi:Ca2+-binding EF-hand superfamily protein
MTRKKKLILAVSGVGLAGILAAAGIAHADRGGGGYGWGGGHGHGRMMMEQFSERYDANKDGKISQDEIDTNRTATFGEFDANKDNGLSLEEFEKVWLKAQRQRMVREFQRFDADGDAKVTLDEYKKPLASIVQRMDANNDGMIDENDHQRRHGKRRGHDGGAGMGQGMGSPDADSDGDAQ